MSTIHLNRKDIFKTKGRLSESPLFDTERLPAHQIARLNSKLAELMADTDTNTTEGDTEDENT